MEQSRLKNFEAMLDRLTTLHSTLMDATNSDVY